MRFTDTFIQRPVLAIVLAAVMLLLEMVGFDLSAWPNVVSWLERCYARESLARARALD